jgi:hypothetical protein
VGTRRETLSVMSDGFLGRKAYDLDRNGKLKVHVFLFLSKASYLR